MTFKEQLQTDIDALFLKSTDFGESVTYRPLGSEPNEKVIVAVVDRDPPEPFGLDEAGTGVIEFEMTISRDAANGIATVTPGRDKVLMPLEEGGTPVLLRVVRVIGRDLVSWDVVVRR